MEVNISDLEILGYYDREVICLDKKNNYLYIWRDNVDVQLCESWYMFDLSERQDLLLLFLNKELFTTELLKLVQPKMFKRPYSDMGKLIPELDI